MSIRRNHSLTLFKQERSFSSIPLDRMWEQDLAVIEDNQYSHRALTEPDYLQALIYIAEAKREELDAAHAIQP